MNIEVGDVVKLNNGGVHEVDRMIGDDPSRVDECGVGPFVIDGSLYHQDGRFGYKGLGHPLSVKRILRKASSFTLHDLQVGPGDVVEYDGTWGGEVKRHTIAGWVGDKCYHMGQDFGGACSMNLNSCWRIISRASDDTLGERATVENIAEKAPVNVTMTGLYEDFSPPKLRRDMTDEEKGALLLAHCEVKVIGVDYGHGCGWESVDGPVWWDSVAYRVKPEPVRETVKLYGRVNSSVWGKICPEDTHRITFDLIDGEPDCSSIKMEKV